MYYYLYKMKQCLNKFLYIGMLYFRTKAIQFLVDPKIWWYQYFSYYIYTITKLSMLPGRCLNFYRQFSHSWTTNCVIFLKLQLCLCSSNSCLKVEKIDFCFGKVLFCFSRTHTYCAHKISLHWKHFFITVILEAGAGHKPIKVNNTSCV